MPRRVALFLAVLALLTTASCGSALGARFYTANYGSTGEVIGGFDLGSDGALAPIPGSPFPSVVASASEPGGILGFAFTPEGSRAVAPFFFTGGVQGYFVPPGGIFSVAGNPIPTASATAVAVTPDGRFAFVSTREFMGKLAEGIRRFAIGPDGSLTPLEPAGPLVDDSYDVAVTPDGRFLFAQNGNLIQRFAIGSDGSLTPLGSTPATGVFHMFASPDNRFLFAEILGGLASYAIGADGSLTQVGLPAPTGEPGILRGAVAPDGRHVYIPDRNKDLIHTVAIAADGTPSLVGTGTPVKDPEAVGISPDGRFLVFYRGGGSDNALGVAALGADGVPAVLPFETPWTSGEPEPIVFQPQPAPVARFTVQPGAPGEATRFDAGGSTGAARYDWTFGDGTTLVDGGPRPTHVYARPGAYEATLTVSDANGCSTRRVYNGQTTLCPGGATTVVRGTVDTLPALTNLKAAPKRFKPKPPKSKGGKGFGTTFRFRLSEAATARFKFERKKAGRLVKGKCRPRTAGNSGKKKCSIFKRLGSRSKAGKAGANRLKFNGNLRGKPLPPGAYRATVVATDNAGGRSAPKTVGFRILPLPKDP